MINIRNAEITDAERLVEIYGYYVKNTAITFEYDIPSLTEFRQLMEQRNLPLGLFDLHAFVEVADIRNGNVTASAAAFYVINRSFSK